MVGLRGGEGKRHFWGEERGRKGKVSLGNRYRARYSEERVFSVVSKGFISYKKKHIYNICQFSSQFRLFYCGEKLIGRSQSGTPLRVSESAVGGKKRGEGRVRQSGSQVGLKVNTGHARCGRKLLVTFWEEKVELSHCGSERGREVRSKGGKNEDRKVKRQGVHVLEREGGRESGRETKVRVNLFTDSNTLSRLPRSTRRPGQTD